ncbi:hypothetical protein [Mycobacterium sp. NAZ190054]|uniref:hypothetical protein n=1 Tax=Mycobacterium sp. NAZ190054 TaxID=1747766 RepID=UPI00079309E8|nr:hypothetical protein [Mycobacterium sp. NAZ190054]KWX65821.1 hypothetical protein ASJ79_27725 [Mycobacterium sp. NAZ190054]
MVRVFAAASAAFVALGACPWISPAAAAGGDQTVRVQNGQIRCLLSTDFEGRGYPAAVCARTDGRPFGVSPAPLNLAVVQGTGELYFKAGTLPGPESADIVLGVGQTYRVNGWTVKTEELRTLITEDQHGDHGIRVNPVDVTAVWM